MTPLVIVRPEPGAQHTAARARALGFHPQCCPLFVVQPRAWTPPADRFDALMITSANAVRHAGPALGAYTGLPAYAVGATTAAAVRAAGFGTVQTGAEDSGALIGMMQRDGVRHALHLCGADVADTAPTPFTLTRCVVYRAVPQDPPPALPPEAMVLVHSPRAARRLADIVAQAQRPNYSLYALSAATAAAAGVGWSAVHVAPQPTDDALLALVAQTCKTRL